jgi:hypothetical protein
MAQGIVELPGLVDALPHEAREAFNRIFEVEVVQGVLKPPPQMLPWIVRQFGSIESVTSQSVVKVTNRVTLEGTVYNTLRALRPHNFQAADSPVVFSQPAEDPFASPLQFTTEDPFGRVEGRYCITAGNVAKCEGHHGVIIFNEYDPQTFGLDQVTDYIETGWKWARRAHGYDPQAQFYLFLWNCSNRAGASIAHGHAQAVLGKRRHYGKVEQLRLAANSYKDGYHRDYFDDLFLAHRALGLGREAGGLRTMAYLSALRLNEVMILDSGDAADLAGAVYQVLASFRDKMGVRSFNVGIAYPPFDMLEGWEGFPVVARILDRGRTGNLSSDISAMEFYGSNVVSSDPFETAKYIMPDLE